MLQFQPREHINFAYAKHRRQEGSSLRDRSAINSDPLAAIVSLDLAHGFHLGSTSGSADLPVRLISARAT
jgi:hypothetical protein